MNLPAKRPPTEAEIEQLLSARLRRTSPEFEQRWRELRHGWSRGSAAERSAGWGSLLWPGLAAALLGLAGLLVWRPATDEPASMPVPFEELIALDELLQPAAALLDAENRDALLHLPADGQL